MNRITVEEAQQAFEKTNRTPKIGKYFQTLEVIDFTIDCACGIGALFLQNAPKETIEKALSDNYNTDLIVNNWANAIYGYFYRLGFVKGFDGEKLKDYLSETDDFKNGYHDGSSVRLALGVQLD